MNDVPRVNTSWDLVCRALEIQKTRITDETDDATVTYVLKRNGSSVGSGSLAWEDHDYTDAWVARFALPSTPGPLTAVVTASATIDGETVTGVFQTSLRVEASA